MEQKLFYVSDIDKGSMKTLDKYLAEGWRIKDISACATSLVNYCWMVLERDHPRNSAGPK